MKLFLILVIISLVLSSLIGGIVAKKLSNKINYLLGFVAGLMLGVVAFDLLPEIFEMASEGIGYVLPMSGFVLGFIGFHFIEKLTTVHTEHERGYKEHTHLHTGKLSTFALIIHRFLDGLSIGVAFGLNEALGIAISIAVIAHSFVDGINLVSLGKLYKQDKHINFLLILSSVAPVFGIALASILHLPQIVLAVYLAIFAGFLLYLSVADILPEAHRQKSQWTVFLLTILGIAVMFVLSSLA